ncbi:MAG: aldehyde dehydrogenase family protein [Rhodobacteraceae bacterium]|nr:aldehyde dehydrogenase family protein [Paracoccaceae bacterium]
MKELISLGESKGGKVIADGRQAKVSDAPDGFYVGPTVIDQVEYGNDIATTEIFGPVLSVMRAKTLNEAIAAAKAGVVGLAVAFGAQI